MGYKLIWTDAFRGDLDCAVSYIALALENKVAAAFLLDAVDKCCDELERMPLMYEACRDPYLKEHGYRKTLIHNYVLVYKVEEDAKTVFLMRFFHGRQDYEKLI